MPLHTDKPGMRRGFNRFNDAVGCPGGDTQDFRQSFDSLVVAAVDPDSFRQQRGEASVLNDYNLMIRRCAGRAFHVALALFGRFQILVQRSAESNIHDLKSQAYPQNGQPPRIGLSNQGYLELGASSGLWTFAVSRRFSPQRWRDVATAGQYKPIDTVKMMEPMRGIRM